MNDVCGRPVREMEGVTPEIFVREIADGAVPVVMRGLAADWSSVRAARTSDQAIAAHLLEFDGGRDADVMVGPATIAGRFFYGEDMKGFNFERGVAPIRTLVDQLLAMANMAGAPAIYAGAAAAEEHLPGWTAVNRLPLPTPDAVPRIWIGNPSRVSTHYDVSSNIAVVVAGTRRFALFPPSQGPNLYVGPLDLTLAGQPVSMVDLERPDLDRYPRFTAARETMMVTTLAPGDAIFMPSLWWHDVKALGTFNVLVNYWWGQKGAVSPFPALVHAILAIRDLPAPEREAVRGWFDQYVFAADAAEAATAHLPTHIHGVLGTPSPERTTLIRDYLMRTLARD